MQASKEPQVTDKLRFIKGIGPHRAQALERLGIYTVRDLFYYFPRRYEDRSNLSPISELEPGITTTIRGEILDVKYRPIRHMPLVDVTVGDASGLIHAVWFNQPYLKKQFQSGQEIILHGKVDLYKKQLQFSAPEFELAEDDADPVHTSRITPVYPLTVGLFQRSLRRTLHHLITERLKQYIQEYFPAELLEDRRLVELPTAIKEMHFPTSFERQIEARRRIVFDEFLCFELMILKRIENLRNSYKSFPLKQGLAALNNFESKLPFRLTQDQGKSILAIIEDTEQSFPMNRLLHGDVGSGKTLVAAFALYHASQNQTQAALLVPTEILAMQHYKKISALMKPWGTRVELLSANVSADRRNQILGQLRRGELDVLIGTHALLQEDVRFHSLSLLIIDEQHKFGVHQRSKLLKREPRPHQLVMTATPIPRTLALTIYGDLSISEIRQMPSGRSGIDTYWVTRHKQADVLSHILKRIESGEQAYFIFPLIHETEKSDLLAAEREFQKLKKSFFRNIPIGLVHGKIPSDEREWTMQQFHSGQMKALVATSVIEVGIDNPNATVMVIENAERFGLSQLHQMRGRIGRGSKNSVCFLFGEPTTEEGKKRLRIMTKSQDGFLIAEEDMRLRGHGDFLGTRQSGMPGFQVADPIEDESILIEAKETAKKILRHYNDKTNTTWHQTYATLTQTVLNY